MAKYFEELGNLCDHQQSSLVNLLQDNGSSLAIFDKEDDNGTYCIKCRSLSDASSMLAFDQASLDSSSRGASLNDIYQRGLQTHLINTSEGDEMPLLNNEEEIDLNPEDPDHCHGPLPVANNTPFIQLLVACLMCLIFMVGEIVGSYLAGSLAIMTDAVHLLSDFVGFLISLIAFWLGRRPATKRLPFGYHRAEVLGALLSLSIIWILTGIFVFMAVHRIIHQDFEINANTMMTVAALAIFINIMIGLVLHGGLCTNLNGHHSHIHNNNNHHHKEQNMNVRSAIIHVIGDLIHSIGVFLSAVVIKFFPQAKLVDPLCTFAFSILVVATTLPIARDAINVLMESWPRAIDYTAVLGRLLAVPGVRHVHDLRVWTLTTGRYTLSVHLAIDSTEDSDKILHKAIRAIRRNFPSIANTTIQIEKFHPETARTCQQCQSFGD